VDSYLELMEQPCPQAEPVANTAKLAWAMSSRSSVVRASSSLLPAMVPSEVSRLC
jgi:hypothetical protein